MGRGCGEKKWGRVVRRAAGGALSPTRHISQLESADLVCRTTLSEARKVGGGRGGLCPILNHGPAHNHHRVYMEACKPRAGAGGGLIVNSVSSFADEGVTDRVLDPARAAIL